MANPEHAAAAARLQAIAATVPAEEYAEQVRAVMRQQFIKGGISAMTALIDSIPAKVLELPEEQRMVVGVMVTVIETFIDKMQVQLREVSGR